MSISVIIPALNSAATLLDTLQAIWSGTRKPDELIVVDGGSTDATISLARDHGAQVVHNAAKHAARARQLGVEQATGDIIAFTDSDCIPATNWLEQIYRCYHEYKGAAGVGGRVVLSQPLNEIQAYSAGVFEAIMNFPETPTAVTKLGMRGTFPGANCSFTRDSILAVGGFSDYFANHAEEVDLFWRLLKQGALLIFDPRIVVEHVGYPGSIRKLLKTNFRYGISSTKLAKVHLGNRIDVALYSSFIDRLVKVINPCRHDKTDFWATLQLGSFIWGKVYASLKLGVINL